MKKKVLVVGAGNMAKSYLKVMKDMAVDYRFVCRTKDSAASFFHDTGVTPSHGGLESYLEREQPEFAIVATGVEHLAQAAALLIKRGTNNILLEKPGALKLTELESLRNQSRNAGCNVYIAYNRRFYQSVTTAIKHIERDGGLQSIHFDFTEWSDSISPLEKGLGVKEHWVLSNSSHVIDLAFFLAGKPKLISSYSSGSSDWHPSGMHFSGAGRTEAEVMFSYRADWNSQGRWAIAAYTKNNSYFLSPLEKLSYSPRNSLELKPMHFDDQLDKNYKPGLFLQVQHFLESNASTLCKIDDHSILFPIYNQIAGYRNC